VVGASLGGGVGGTMGLFGLLADNVISVRIVTGKAAELVTASETENSDLFWALRGAGHGLGVVTSVTLKLYPEKELGNENGTVWQYHIQYADKDLKAISDRMFELNSLQNSKFETEIFLGCLPPTFQPSVNLFANYLGSESEKDATLAELDSIAKPLVRKGGLVPAVRLNDAADAFGDPEGTKFMRSVGLKQQFYNLQEIYEEYKQLLKDSPDSARGGILIELHPCKAVYEASKDFNAFPHRDVRAWL
jgi:hypothetical protein